MPSDCRKPGTRRGLTEKQQRFVSAYVETLDVPAAALAAGYSKRTAKTVGESLSDVLQGLEQDILRILTRTLVTEPLAAGIRGGLEPLFGGGADEVFSERGGLSGGLEGLVGGLFASLGGLFDGEESGAAEAASALASLDAAGGAAGDALSGALTEGAFEAGLESLTQAGASSVATTQLAELAVAAGAAAAALQTVAATSAASSAAGGAGGLGSLLSSTFPLGGSGGPAGLPPGAGTPGPQGGAFLQAGGPVHGPGGPRGDRIPALLSDGEFVVNAKAARRYRLLLERFNADMPAAAYATGGAVPPFLRYVSADVRPPSPVSPAAAPQRESSFAGRPVVVHIHNPTSVPEIQRGMAQIRGSLREMLARAERRGK